MKAQIVVYVRDSLCSNRLKLIAEIKSIIPNSSKIKIRVDTNSIFEKSAELNNLVNDIVAHKIETIYIVDGSLFNDYNFLTICKLHNVQVKIIDRELKTMSDIRLQYVNDIFKYIKNNFDRLQIRSLRDNLINRLCGLNDLVGLSYE
jgi:hypothetical protein